MQHSVLLVLNSVFAHSKEEWDLLAISGDGESNYKFSHCYKESYFSKKIAPLDGEMEWDSKKNPKLDVNIISVGKINNVEYFDVIQEYVTQPYNYRQQIKIIAFSKEGDLLCPFYAWQPINGYIKKMNSQITNAKTNMVIGHELRVYRGTDNEYFAIHKGQPSRLNFIKLANDYVKINYPDQRIRVDELDIKNLAYTIKLSKGSDANCCPTGKSITLFFSIKDGGLEFVKAEDAPHKTFDADYYRKKRKEKLKEESES